jgi:16S rRNA pseudouridine516 synthase
LYFPTLVKLDRLIAKHRLMGRAAAHRKIAAGAVRVDGAVIINGAREIDRFMLVEMEGVVIQQPDSALYLMMHKPAGHLCATKDAEHATVLDLIAHPEKATLHLAGRLDRASTGLILLTNDGRWSKALMHPDHHVQKVYRVETDVAVPAEAVAAFERGFYFHTEDITTLPARLEIVAERVARVTLHEGRYHQVKRMFHRVGCRVMALHRESIGGLRLPEALRPGQWRELTEGERLAVKDEKEARF